MRFLLSDLDSASSLPPRTVERVRYSTETPNSKARTRGASTTAHLDNNDMTTLLDGAEDWDWSDMLSPAKAASGGTPQRSSTAAQAPERRGPKADKDTLPTIQVASATMSREGVDITMLLEGAEDWDWSDMLTPKKGTASPKKPKLSPGLGSPKKSLPHIRQREFRGPICTRCIVQSVSLISVGRSSQKVRILHPSSTK